MAGAEMTSAPKHRWHESEYLYGPHCAPAAHRSDIFECSITRSWLHGKSCPLLGQGPSEVLQTIACPFTTSTTMSYTRMLLQSPNKTVNSFDRSHAHNQYDLALSTTAVYHQGCHVILWQCARSQAR